MELDKRQIAALRPDFSEEDIESIKLYHHLNEKYGQQLSKDMRKDLQTHPVFGKLINMITEEEQQQRDEISRTLMHNALYKNQWDAYITDLTMQGITYAKMGMTFSDWYEVISMVKEYIMPYVRKEFSDEPEKIIETISGLGKLTDWAMKVIAESYFIEKRKVIHEQQTRQEKLIKELEEFAYVVSHDLKTPLRGISKISEWLVKDYEDVLDDNGKKQLKLLQNRVERMDHLIDGILQYSRVESNETENEVTDLNQVVSEVMKLNHFEPEPELDIKTPLPQVQYDPAKINQVFSNLITNAVKYNDKGKCKIEIDCTDRNNFWEISVKDNGKGIDPQYADKVFAIFQTLQPKEDASSTGLGLAIVRKIIENSGGKIWLGEDSAEGARFCFTLPKVKDID